MKIEGQHTFDAPRDLVWQAVLDPDVLTKVLPGCEDFQQIEANEFEGLLKIKVGPVQGKFKGKVKLSDLVEPSSYHLVVDGKGAPGFVNGEGDLRLEENGGQTVLHYSVDAKVGGRIASVGQRLMDSSAKSISRQAIDGLDQIIRVRAAAAAAGVEPAEVEIEAPSPAEVAREVAKDVVADLVPPSSRPLVIGAAVLGLLVVAALVLRGCV